MCIAHSSPTSSRHVRYDSHAPPFSSTSTKPLISLRPRIYQKHSYSCTVSYQYYGTSEVRSYSSSIVIRSAIRDTAVPLDPFVRIRGSTSSVRIRTQYGSARFSNICSEQNNESLFKSRSAGLNFDFTVSGSLLVLQ